MSKKEEQGPHSAFEAYQAELSRMAAINKTIADGQRELSRIETDRMNQEAKLAKARLDFLKACPDLANTLQDKVEEYDGALHRINADQAKLTGNRAERRKAAAGAK